LNVVLERSDLSDEHREEARELYRELSEPAVLTQLMRSLEDGSIDPSGSELGVFLKHLGPAAMPVLLAAIERTEVTTLQERLRAAIEGLANENRDRVVALLGEKDPQVLRGAARLAGQLTITQAAPALTQLLQHPDAIVRRIVVESLIRIRTSFALDAVQQALGDGDRDVRVAAARGLATLRYAPARARIEEMLESRIVRDADLTEKIAFFEAYGAVATPESVALLDRMLNGRRLFGRESPEMRACAAMALGRVGSPAARAALQKAGAESNPIVRNAVMKALRLEAE
ncbi:MAG: HEAT repeat domain-containing protein, partial [Longimicrobiales bacterium]